MQGGTFFVGAVQIIADVHKVYKTFNCLFGHIHEITWIWQKVVVSVKLMYYNRKARSGAIFTGKRVFLCFLRSISAI